MNDVRGRIANFKDIDENNLKISPKKDSAAGLKAVQVSFKRSLFHGGVRRTVGNFYRVNQDKGVDCPGCAWPESITGDRKQVEFCENGAKALAEEHTKRICPPEWWAQHSISELDKKTEYWLGQSGRITHPMIIREGRPTTSPSPGMRPSRPSVSTSGRPLRSGRCSTLRAAHRTRRRSCSS